MTAKNKKSVYACVNNQENYIPPEIKNQTISIQADIKKVMEDLLLKQD